MLTPTTRAITTGGSLARASAEGHRVVVVIATNGDYGEVPDDLADGESLVDRRRAETARSAAALGVHRLVWLGYKDSGMTGWEQNSDPASFLQAPVDEAAERLADVLREEAADVLTVYDWHGNYGHPDHIKVHTVGHRAAEMAGIETGLRGDDEPRPRRAAVRGRSRGRCTDRTGRRRLRSRTVRPTTAIRSGWRSPSSPTRSTCRPSSTAKRESVRAHRSQVTDTSFFLEMPDERLAQAFGTEWFIQKGAQPGLRPGWLFE